MLWKTATPRPPDGASFEGDVACIDLSCFKIRSAYLDIGQLKSRRTYLKLCFCDSKHEASDSKTWRRVTEPWKSDSCANAVTRVRSKDIIVDAFAEGVDAARVRDARPAPTGAGSLAAAHKQVRYCPASQAIRQTSWQIAANLTRFGTRHLKLWKCDSDLCLSDSRSRFYDSETNGV